MVYKYFVGVTSQDEAKVRFRDLAKEHHPDKGGKEVVFKEVLAEYNHVVRVKMYPVCNIPIFALSDEPIYDIVDDEPYVPEEKVTHLTPDELNKQKATSFYNGLRISDYRFDIIDTLCTSKPKFLDFFRAVCSIEGLNLNHFKYITFVMGLSVDKATGFYKQYLSTQ